MVASAINALVVDDAADSKATWDKGSKTGAGDCSAMTVILLSLQVRETGGGFQAFLNGEIGAAFALQLAGRLSA